MKDVITIHDLMKEIAKLYTELGNKLAEVDRMIKNDKKEGKNDK